MIDINAFLDAPYNRQLHLCVLHWLYNQHIQPFEGGKLVREYFVCRTFLFKMDRQTVKNIALMLFDTLDPVPMYELKHKAAQFVRAQQIKAEAAKAPAKKEYEIDLESFLRR